MALTRQVSHVTNVNLAQYGVGGRDLTVPDPPPQLQQPSVTQVFLKDQSTLGAPQRWPGIVTMNTCSCPAALTYLSLFASVFVSMSIYLFTIYVYRLLCLMVLNNETFLVTRAFQGWKCTKADRHHHLLRHPIFLPARSSPTLQQVKEDRCSSSYSCRKRSSSI